MGKTNCCLKSKKFQRQFCTGSRSEGRPHCVWPSVSSFQVLFAAKNQAKADGQCSGFLALLISKTTPGQRARTIGGGSRDGDVFPPSFD